MINNDDDAEDIAKKREEAQKEYGIAEEQIAKKLVKEEVVDRRNLFNNEKQTQNSKETNIKSASAAKNYTGSSLGNKQPLMNNLVNPSMNLVGNKNPLMNPNMPKGR